MTDFKELKWIAVDWGTSHMRLWLMGEAGTVLDRRHSNQGMNALAPSEFAPHLREILSDLPETLNHRTPIVCCGMVGSRQGWVEAPYISVPCAPPSIKQASRTEIGSFDVFILPGIKQLDHPDVMRGEETQIAGFLTKFNNYTGVICLPGTHNKWVQINEGLVRSFSTYLSGELFDILSQKSVLKHSLTDGKWDSTSFKNAVTEVIKNPETFASSLFPLRAANLLTNADTYSAYSRLSGLIIGSELASARSYWENKPITIIGENGISKAYTEALEALGNTVEHLNSEAITLRGLKTAYETLKEPTT
ncbi:2-dehydro-3-deoxygalactonokinase [Kiloniella majae]|uniref:2-dehydro-3-deoxygalactonokinase n=1 Tax=Kiloniella majae TaxID=1938558 RepID=UPI000A276FC9|nr:2-dehydro-3-deoxygalactonokinase [Kiloniella majae]